MQKWTKRYLPEPGEEGGYYKFNGEVKFDGTIWFGKKKMGSGWEERTFEEAQIVEEGTNG